MLFIKPAPVVEEEVVVARAVSVAEINHYLTTNNTGFVYSEGDNGPQLENDEYTVVLEDEEQDALIDATREFVSSIRQNVMNAIIKRS